MYFELLYPFLCVFCIFLVGSCLEAFIKKPEGFFYRLFFILTAGTTTFTFSYALIASGGKTILLLLIPLLAYAIYRLRPIKFCVPSLNKVQYPGTVLTVFLPILFYHLLFYYDYKFDTYKFLFIDSYYFSDFANGLKLWGSESKFSEINAYFPENRGVLVPYHYPELWLTAGFSSLTGVSTLFSYCLITIPLLTLTFSLGIMALFENVISNKAVIITCAILCIMLSGIFLPMYEKSFLQDYAHWSESSILGRALPKYGYVFIFLLHTIILFIKNKKIESFITLLFLPILSLTFLPATFGAALVVAGALFTDKKKQTIKDLLLLGILAAILGIGYLIFYSSFGSNYTNDFAMKTSFIGKCLHRSVQVYDVKIFLGNFMLRSGVVFLFFIPYLFFFILSARKLPMLSLFSFSFMFFGIFASCLLYPVMDSSQFGSATLIILNILIITGVVQYIAQSKNHSLSLRITIFSFFIVACLWSLFYSIKQKNTYDESFSHDKDFMEQVSNSLSGNYARILLFLSEKDYTPYGFPNCFVANDLYKLEQFTNTALIFSLGNPENYFSLHPKPLPEDVFYYENACALRVWRKKHPTKTTEDFIKAFQIKYLYVHKECEADDLLSSLKKKSITSKETGHIFYILE